MSAAVRTSHNHTARRRVARKRHACQWGGCPRHCRIEPGDVYLECTEFPGADPGYASHAGKPVRMALGTRCAVSFGHEHLLEPIPYDQVCQDGLL